MIVNYRCGLKVIANVMRLGEVQLNANVLQTINTHPFHSSPVLHSWEKQLSLASAHCLQVCTDRNWYLFN